VFDDIKKGSFYKGHYICMPSWANADLMFYRKDLLAEQGFDHFPGPGMNLGYRGSYKGIQIKGHLWVRNWRKQ